MHQAYCCNQKRKTFHITYYMPISMMKDLFCDHFVLCINSVWRKFGIFCYRGTSFQIIKALSIFVISGNALYQVKANKKHSIWVSQKIEYCHQCSSRKTFFKTFDQSSWVIFQNNKYKSSYFHNFFEL